MASGFMMELSDAQKFNKDAVGILRDWRKGGRPAVQVTEEFAGEWRGKLEGMSDDFFTVEDGILMVASLHSLAGSYGIDDGRLIEKYDELVGLVVRSILIKDEAEVDHGLNEAWILAVNDVLSTKPSVNIPNPPDGKLT